MAGALVRFYRKINPQRRPEDSLPLRISILASVLVAEATILAMGYYGTMDVVAIPLLTAAGYFTSWKLRRRRNLALKFVLSLLVAAAALLFLRELASSLYDTRLPLIKLLLWLQVLHSFDVPSRRDLKFSLASGAVLITAGAVLSTGMAYVLGLACFSAAAVVALVYFYLSEEGQRLGRPTPVKVRHALSLAAVTWITGACLSLPLLLLVPQSLEARLYSLPFSDFQRFFGDFNGQVDNPYYPSAGDPFNHEPRFNPDSYYGFNSYMDLRSRGNLSDEVVLKVKTGSYNFYRGIVFDRYNGKGWEISDEKMREITVDSPPFDLNLPNYLAPDIMTRVESFYVQQDMPNVIFTSWKPVQLFFPADRIETDQFQSIRAPYQLTAGTVYSVVTDQPLLDPEFLRRFPIGREGDYETDSLYTQLDSPDPRDLARVRDLAESVTRPYPTRYDKAAAIEDYLKENYPYDLDIPPQDKDMDSVAYFLFEQKAGYCEHFASAMAVMARSVGIPARVVTGYTGGEYNPFTAMWEIRQSDAHAWVEVYFGSAGWVPFDPTPGFDYPSGDRQGAWMAGRVFTYLGGLIADSPLGDAFRTLSAGTERVVSLALALPLASLLTALAAALLVAYAGYRGLKRLTRGRRWRRRMASTLGAGYGREPVLRDYLDLSVALRERGLVRASGETLRGFAGRVGRFLGDDDFSRLSAMVERVRYGGADPGPLGGRAAALREAVSARLRSRES